jgi:hypothetical protein
VLYSDDGNDILYYMRHEDVGDLSRAPRGIVGGAVKETIVSKAKSVPAAAYICFAMVASRWRC